MTSFATMSDGDIAHHFARTIPHGRWTSYTVIADCVLAVTAKRYRRSPLNGWRVAMLLLPTQGAPWHRLRNIHGVYNPPGHIPDGLGRKGEFDALLRAEGCAMRGDEACDSGFIGTTRMLELAKITPTALAAARAADPDLAARVAARRARLRADRPVA